MTPNSRGQPVMLAAAALAVTAAWLWYGPSLAASLIGADGGAVADALFALLVFAPLLLLALVGGALTLTAPWSLGPRPTQAAGRGFALGLGALLLAVGYAALAGGVRSGGGGAFGGVLLLGVVAVAVQVLAEEMLFRGWLQPLAVRTIGAPAGVLVIAVLFALLHLIAGGGSGVATVNLMLGGVLFGLLALRDGGIAGAVAAHFAYNATEQVGLGLDPNPGVGSFGSIIDLELVGALRWGGSDHGLNASWAMTFALAGVIALSLIGSKGLRMPARAAV